LWLDAELLLDLGRQTGGAGVVVSARAVLDGDVGRWHGSSFGWTFYQPPGWTLEERNEMAGANVEKL
jgi:hypothetical protein